MSTKAYSIAFVVLLLASLVPPMASTIEEGRAVEHLPEEGLFSGFFVGSQDDVWNQTSYPATAVPEGFTFESVTDYSDVGVVTVSYTHLTLPTKRIV